MSSATASSASWWRTARKLITGARGIDASDLDLPEKFPGIGVDYAEVEKELLALKYLKKSANDLKLLLSAPDTASLETLRDLMLPAASSVCQVRFRFARRQICRRQ